MLNSRSPMPTDVAAGRAGAAAPAPAAPIRAAAIAASRPAGGAPRARVMLMGSARARRSLMFSVGQVDALDRLVLDRAVAGARRGALDGVDRIHARGHASEHGVLAVEPRRRVGGDDEELRAVGVRAGVGHGERAALDLVLVELVLERVAGTAGAGALGAAALDHEVGDHAMEDEAVVEAVGGELAEVLDRL